ncbi:MAG TPA: hypothetical protein VGE26_03635 [Sphingobacteriaceae bacterium]
MKNQKKAPQTDSNKRKPQSEYQASKNSKTESPVTSKPRKEKK